MKIICVGRNYKAHAQELNNEVPEQPVIFIKSESSVVTTNTITFPKRIEELHYEAELIVKIKREAKNINVKEVNDYIESVSLGIDFTDRKLQSFLKQKRLPWELSKSFDNACVIGEWLPIANLNLNATSFSMLINQEIVQEGNTKNMIFSIGEILEFVSQYITLQQGDVIFTGTPEGVGIVNDGDRLIGVIGDVQVFEHQVLFD